MKKVLFVCFTIACSFWTTAQSSAQIDSLFRNSYSVFELQRLPNGMYRDSKLLNGSDFHPISISNTGMGLISLCIADAMGWINNAEQLALTTLMTATGHSAGFNPDRTTNGYYRHFLDVNSGAQAWNSEYSTIDTDILVCGALFCMNYFQSSNISQYVMELWNSIDFNAAIANPSSGKIYLKLNANGGGVSGSLTSPYNEYMITAWLAKNYSNDPNSPGNILWNNHYNSTLTLPNINYSNISVLSDNVNSFLSSFTHQFNYYLCNYFCNSFEYLNYFENSRKADSAWWSNNAIYSYEWGLGAGSSISNSYHADAINNNADVIVSPHIIAGYIPIHPNSKNDLINLWNNNLGKYTLPGGNNQPFLWRYSKINPLWVPNEVIGVDYALMLFGLSALPEYLGENFFSTNNDFFPLIEPNTIVVSLLKNIQAYPNPTKNKLTIQLEQIHPKISVKITNIWGQVVFNENFLNAKKLSIPLKLMSGIYIVTVDNNEYIKTFKIEKQ